MSFTNESKHLLMNISEDFISEGIKVKCCVFSSDFINFILVLLLQLVNILGMIIFHMFNCFFINFASAIPLHRSSNILCFHLILIALLFQQFKLPIIVDADIFPLLIEVINEFPDLMIEVVL